MFRLRDGRRVLPMLPPAVVVELGLRKFKMVQTTLQDVELRYVPDAAGGVLSQEAAQRVVDQYVARGFTVRPIPLAHIPHGASGKYRMHESLLAE